MGTQQAASYDNVFMTALEEEMIENYHLKPRVWLRYKDNIFFIWDLGENELNEQLAYLNGEYTTNIFTSDWSRKEINFLDMTVKVHEDTIH